jgi:pyrimidine deaminase RibD-like protein
VEQDEKLMKRAIALAEQCRPVAARIPKVGAVIAVGGIIIGEGYRGSGTADDDDHAEKRALASVVAKSELPRATVFTTLEPCTRDVRSDPLNCCTELIGHARVEKVFIGILDPNQGVRGKGLWELQSRGIQVELFPPDLASELLVQNAEFIKAQQSLGIQITNVTQGQEIRTYDRGGTFDLEGTCLNPPGEDVFALTGVNNQWWPQPYPLHTTEPGKWAVKLHFGAYVEHRIAIVRANDAGATLMRYYQKVARSNRDREARVKACLKDYKLDKSVAEGILGALRGSYPSIEMGKLPKGIELQDQINVIVEQPPKQANTQESS